MSIFLFLILSIFFSVSHDLKFDLFFDFFSFKFKLTLILGRSVIFSSSSFFLFSLTFIFVPSKPIPNTSLNFKLNWANYHNSTAKTVYVGNLNPSVDDISLFNFFKSKYKSVSKAKIISGHRQSKKYGFVTFKKENDYRRSLIEMNGIVFEGTRIKVKEYKRKKEEGS